MAFSNESLIDNNCIVSFVTLDFYWHLCKFDWISSHAALTFVDHFFIELSWIKKQCVVLSSISGSMRVFQLLDIL